MWSIFGTLDFTPKTSTRDLSGVQWACANSPWLLCKAAAKSSFCIESQTPNPGVVPLFLLCPGAILIIGKRRISITAGIWGTPVRHNNTEPSVHVCAALLGRCGSNFEFSKPLAASPASPNPPTAAARRVRSCTTSRAPRGLLLPPTTRHYATVDNAGLCSPTSHPELPCRARSWPAR